MQLSHLLALLPLLAAVEGKKWHRCQCQRTNSGNIDDNWQLTYNVCARVFKNTGEYRAGEAQCHAINGSLFDIEEFNRECATMASNGYYHVDGTGMDYSAGLWTWPLGRGEKYRTHCD